jgi:hypothetical protein
MRDRIAATGLEFEELDDYDAVDLACLSAVQRLQRRGLLSHQEYLCHTAARCGNLEKLKEFRANDIPWARTNGCPWDADTCKRAAGNGQLEVLQWLRANGCPWD